jgi:hypothetical protein
MKRKHVAGRRRRLSAAAALLHLMVIAGGPDWYRFFGAGRRWRARPSKAPFVPPLVTFGIAVILGVWAAYAFSGAGLIRRLPWSERRWS